MMLPLSLSLLVSVFSCKKEEPETCVLPVNGWNPDFQCPGDPNCCTAEGPLLVGASAFSITPTCFEGWLDCGEDGLCVGDEGYTEPDNGEGDGEWKKSTEAYLDCGCDRLCPGDEGYASPDDGEADGVFQAVWMAGFQNSRPANGVHDDLWARAIVFEKGETRVGLVVVDLVGWFYEDVVKTRELLDGEGAEVDHLIVASTHAHEGPDTMGIWGETAFLTGYDQDYAAYVRSQSAAAVQAAILDLRELGSMAVGNVDVAHQTDNGTSNLVRDSRDPKIIDSLLSAAIFRDTSGETIATLSHFGNHPEAMADENVLITSDFVGPLRDGLESGVHYDAYDRPGYGGVSVFFSGTVGGLMTPLGITVVDGEGTEWRDYTFERNEAMGKVMAELAMDALDEAESSKDRTLRFGGSVMRMPVENYGFQTMFLAGIIDREIYDYDPTEEIEEGNIPKAETEMNVLQVGPLTMLTVPGELFPELAVGGYDGSRVGDPNLDMINSDNPNPPDVSQAPEGPYLLDQVPTEFGWILGLGNDEVGYIIPAYDFILNDSSPWFDEAEGDHYEETNSLGPETAPQVVELGEKLLEWSGK